MWGRGVLQWCVLRGSRRQVQVEGVWVGGVSGSSAATSAMCLVVQPLREKCACETDTAKKAFLQTTLVSTASIHMHGSVCMWGRPRVGCSVKVTKFIGMGGSCVFCEVCVMISRDVM